MIRKSVLVLVVLTALSSSSAQKYIGTTKGIYIDKFCNQKNTIQKMTICRDFGRYSYGRRTPVDMYVMKDGYSNLVDIYTRGVYFYLTEVRRKDGICAGVIIRWHSRNPGADPNNTPAAMIQILKIASGSDSKIIDNYVNNWWKSHDAYTSIDGRFIDSDGTLYIAAAGEDLVLINRNLWK